MANKAPRSCRRPGCPEVTRDPAGFCEAHKKQADLKRWREDTRPAAHLRGYDKRWERFRDWYMSTVEPLCRRCNERGMMIKQADVLHHIVPLNEGGEKLDPENCMSLCRPCHDAEHGGAKNCMK